jgi:hypothetical protein
MRFMVCVLLLSGPAFADEAVELCSTNPAFSRGVMLEIVQEQLARDHDPALDADTPDKLADQAVAQGISECAAEMRADPSIPAAFAGLSGKDREVAWDAYNTACADHRSSKGACIQAEIGAADALKRMVSRNTPPGARSLVQTCQLVMKDDPAMVEWRICVDTALAVHASPAVVETCKVRVNYHVAKTGADAGRVVAACLKAG